MRPRLAFLVPLLAVLAAIPFSACQNEGEGKPCDTQAGNGGNDDCEPPLVCTTGLTNTGANSARCCPQNRATATTPECAISSASTGDGSPAPPVDGSTETSSPEAAGDGPVESATEAGPESGADASDSGTTDGGGGSEAAADGAGE